MKSHKNLTDEMFILYKSLENCKNNWDKQVIIMNRIKSIKKEISKDNFKSKLKEAIRYGN